NSNWPVRGQKRTLWEGGIRMPACVCWPGHVPAGMVSNEIIDMIDLFPTFLAAAGAEPNPAWKVDGVNELPTFEGKAPAPKRILYWHWNEVGNRQFAAMDGRFKLIDSSNNVPQLYDVVADPVERMDIRQLFPAEVKKLTADLKAWYATESPAARQKHPTPDDAPHPIAIDDE
ncbi:MAG TPA: sulfatase/phosphatase domain-containing protein, partial [Tepidisphaeraceae bacterium]|nr:sulfatase/phosphatase domain-containing protein [Tepidisphaeraceae bacterium]